MDRYSFFNYLESIPYGRFGSRRGIRHALQDILDALRANRRADALQELLRRSKRRTTAGAIAHPLGQCGSRQIDIGLHRDEAELSNERFGILELAFHQRPVRRLRPAGREMGQCQIKRWASAR
jgi:hypothetical protein